MVAHTGAEQAFLAAFQALLKKQKVRRWLRWRACGALIVVTRHDGGAG